MEQEYKSPVLDELYMCWNEETPTEFKYFGMVGNAIQEIQALQDHLRVLISAIKSEGRICHTRDLAERFEEKLNL